MTRFFMSAKLRAALVCCCGTFFSAASFVASAGAAPIEGSYQVDTSIAKLASVVAFEVKGDDEPEIVLVASDRPIPTAKIKEALAKDAEASDWLPLKQAYLVVRYSRAGKPLKCKGSFDGGSFMLGGEDIQSTVKFADGRVQGDAKLVRDPEKTFVIAFEMKLDLALGLDGATPAVAKPTGPVVPTVNGTFTGNGRQAKLAFVSARPGEPFGDGPTIDLIFTEKDHTRDPRAAMNAGFGRYGSALVISLHEEGDIFGCQVAHAAHPKGTFSSSGNIATTSFNVFDDRLDGAIATKGEQETFGQTWNVDIKFAAAYARPSKPQPTTEAPASTMSTKTQTTTATTKPVAEVPAAAKVNVHDLPFPKLVGDVEFKTVVEHLNFQSSLPPQTLVAELSRDLAAQGWQTKGRDLVNPNSSIMHRLRGEAELTIFVKPAPGGSKAQLMTEGLDWSKK